jgi:hypothetical protein
VYDRLLASPLDGERWDRLWLDLARYGEDQAHSFQPKLYPYGYFYRDWVVKAFNDDMPYDRFLTEQIAGDLVEGGDREARLAALGYFALGPVYYGNAKADELDDRIDTLCRGMLGLTPVRWDDRRHCPLHGGRLETDQPAQGQQDTDRFRFRQEGEAPRLRAGTLGSLPLPQGGR